MVSIIANILEKLCHCRGLTSNERIFGGDNLTRIAHNFRQIITKSYLFLFVLMRGQWTPCPKTIHTKPVSKPHKWVVQWAHLHNCQRKKKGMQILLAIKFFRISLNTDAKYILNCLESW